MREQPIGAWTSSLDRNLERRIRRVVLGVRHVYTKRGFVFTAYWDNILDFIPDFTITAQQTVIKRDNTIIYINISIKQICFTAFVSGNNDID